MEVWKGQGGGPGAPYIGCARRFLGAIFEPGS